MALKQNLYASCHQADATELNYFTHVQFNTCFIAKLDIQCDQTVKATIFSNL